MTIILNSSAGATAALWLAIHCIVGGRQIAQPLTNATALDPMVRQTQYLCWNFTSVSIACMSGFFLWAAHSETQAFATAATAMAMGFSVIGIALVQRARENHLRYPQGWLFVPVAMLGIAGHVA